GPTEPVTFGMEKGICGRVAPSRLNESFGRLSPFAHPMMPSMMSPMTLSPPASGGSPSSVGSPPVRSPRMGSKGHTILMRDNNSSSFSSDDRSRSNPTMPGPSSMGARGHSMIRLEISMSRSEEHTSELQS